MDPLTLHEFHQALRASFAAVNGAEAVADYGDALAEHSALTETAGLLDLSFRGRLCLTGADRVRFLHGQVTNDVKALRSGEGCYAALTTAKGKLQSDLNLYYLAEELLLDFEPGLEPALSTRLGEYIVADDVQVVDVARSYGLLSVQGPRAEAVVRGLGLFEDLPAKPFHHREHTDADLGEICLANHPRLDTPGYDLFGPLAVLESLANRLLRAAHATRGRLCGWQALETARVEAGLPRFGADIDGTNLPQECGLEARAISYTKGCYIGQEVLNRLHALGHINRQLCGLRLADNLSALPVKGDPFLRRDKAVGYITSAVASPTFKANIALGYVRREACAPGTELKLRTADGESLVRVVELPFCL